MSLYGGVEIVGRPDLENCRRLDLLAIPMIRRAHRLGIAIDREHFHALTSKFEAEMVTLAKDIADYIPPERLHEFCDAADEEEEDEGSAEFNAG